MIIEPETVVIPTFQLGDLAVVDIWPGKMMKALAVIADRLHPAYDLVPGAMRGGSKATCLFSSLAVRDFLVAIGFEDATVRGCAVLLRAIDRVGKEIWSVGLGIPGLEDVDGKFNGHAVCTVPSLSLMIDTTLYQSIRPAWAGAVTGMLACAYTPPAPRKVYDRHQFATAVRELPDREVWVTWLDRPELKWKRDIDFAVKSPRRRAVTQAMIDRFGEWHV